MIEIIVKTKEFKHIFFTLIDKYIDELQNINNYLINDRIESWIQSCKDKDDLINDIYIMFITGFYQYLVLSTSQYYCMRSKNEKDKFIFMFEFTNSISSIDISILHKIFAYEEKYIEKVMFMSEFEFIKLKMEQVILEKKYLSLFIYNIYEIRMKFIKDNFKKHLIPDLVNLIDLYLLN
jgi:hypothetical protein